MTTRRSLWIVAAVLALVAGPAVADAPFSLDLVEPIAGGGASCGEFDLYQQPLGLFGTARTSDADAGFEVTESSLDGGAIAPIPGGEVDGVRVWGIDVDFTGGAGPCAAPEPTAPFTVTFYADNAGQPGTQVNQVTGVTPTVVETGVPFAFTTIQQYDLEFDTVDATGAAWVGVQRESGPDAACFFLWVDETDAATYDNFAWQINGAPPEQTTDQTLCIAGPPPNPLEVPTLGSVGIVLLSLLLAGGAFFVLRRRA